MSECGQVGAPDHVRMSDMDVAREARRRQQRILLITYPMLVLLMPLVFVGFMLTSDESFADLPVVGWLFVASWCSSPC